MPKSPSEHPTELELKILKILWARSPLRVRDVRAELANIGHEVAHTSVISTLNTMCDKGFLDRKPDGNAFLFRPKISKLRVHKDMVHDLASKLFDGSKGAMILRLLEETDLDETELKELRRTINKRLQGDEQ
jgi:BlaI family transcriptional regulator, penicillinase repressor